MTDSNEWTTLLFLPEKPVVSKKMESRKIKKEERDRLY